MQRLSGRSSIEGVLVDCVSVQAEPGLTRLAAKGCPDHPQDGADAGVGTGVVGCGSAVIGPPPS
ncbi:hypothetical protein [Modestobacter altitudinis]|uniref:hypothetical protein n=1 Tax=Modestobacter altitudinis TaxID=2213158 RepID=UPI00110CAE3C|nr:hypothetical protein [Modestobacter altitudinis]